MAGFYLSKSRILSGWQCHKRLWLEVHAPERAQVSSATERAFQVGHQVGDVARRLFPGGILIDTTNLPEAIDETRRRLAMPGPLTLFEATFRHEGVLVRTDVLVRDQLNRIRLVEIKASTKLKPVNYIDCAVQAWVLAGIGLHPATVELAHIDNQFVYPGAENYDGLFEFSDLTDRVGAMLEQVPAWLQQYREMLSADMPSIRVGPQCRNPYECAFLPFCSPPLPDYPIGSLPGTSKTVWELAEEGIEDIRDIPAGRLSNEVQRWVRRVTIEGRPELRPAASEALASLPWPRYHLDFETVSFAVPIWAGTRPYQALPFQWSCHVRDQHGKLDHREWLAEGAGPPMRQCAESLLEALGDRGTIFTYTGYEQNVLRELAAMFPDLAVPLEKIIDRLVDLHPITKANYYHPDMRGSWSIKAVLPTIAADLSYSDLGEVREGAAAADAFLEILHSQTSEERRRQLRVDLSAYCAQDTLALVRLADFLGGSR